MTEAIAEVREMQASGKWASRGTAFAVSRQLALTAFHVIGDRKQGNVRDLLSFVSLGAMPVMQSTMMGTASSTSPFYP